MSRIQDEQYKVQHGLQRLSQFLSIKNVEQLIPAFCYTMKQLEAYMCIEDDCTKINSYLSVFQQCFSKLQENIKAKGSTIKRYVKSSFYQIQTFFKEKAPAMQPSTQSETSKTAAEEAQGQFTKLYQKAVQAFRDHNLDRAHQIIGQIEKLLKQNEIWLDSESVQKQKKQLKRIEKQYQKMINFYSFFGGQGWIKDTEQQNIKMDYKVYEEEKTIAIRISAQVELPIMPFLAIVSQIDLQTLYVPFVQTSKELKQNARNQKAGYSITYMPFISDRECYFYATGCDRLEEKGSVFIYSQSYDDNPQFQERHGLNVPSAQQSELVRIKVHHFCLDYAPITKTKARIRMCAKADMKLTFLPLFILTKTARVFTLGYFEKIVEMAKNFKGSPWETKVQSNPQMYKYFQKKIKQYFGE